MTLNFASLYLGFGLGMPLAFNGDFFESEIELSGIRC